jgi:hypothetical protein
LCWVFWNRVLWTTSLGWLWTVILLIFASQVARITGVSYQCLAKFNFFNYDQSTQITHFLMGKL